MKLFQIFHKNWKPVFCFFGGLNEISAALALADSDFKKIKIKKYYHWTNTDEEGFGEEDFIKILSRLIKKLSKKTSAIICFEQPFAKSSRVRFSVVRDNPLTPIDQEELENVILNLAWRLYDKERIYISQKLRISEWDVVLAASKISEPKIDDKKVLNPIGFTGKSLSFCLENTYLYYLFWEAVKNILEQWGGELLFCAEKNLIFDKITSLIDNGEKIILVEIGPRLTRVGVLGNYLNTFKYFDWGEMNLIKLLAQQLSIPFNLAKEIKEIYQRGELSEYARAWFKKLFEKELKLLVSGITIALKDISLTEKIEYIYLTGGLQNFPDLIQFFESQKWPKSIFLSPLKVKFYNTSQLSKDLNVEFVDFNEQKATVNMVINLSAVFLLENKYEELNKILKRRIKWLNQNLLKKRQ